MGRAAASSKRRGLRWRRWLLVPPLAFAGWLAFEYLTLPDPSALVTKAPAHSSVMRARVAAANAQGRKLALQHAYVPLGRIAPSVQKAVVLAEDAKFWMHDGIDWGETRKAVAEAFEQGRLGRGASTITQQLAKNLYLSESRSLTRKAKEWILADRLEKALTKKRILELYLNFAEWGDGVFGIEAAARTYFRKPAAQLDPAEAAVLAAMLPSPRTRHPARPNRNLVRRSHRIGRLLVQVGVVSRDEIQARLHELVGPERPAASAKR